MRDMRDWHRWTFVGVGLALPAVAVAASSDVVAATWRTVTGLWAAAGTGTRLGVAAAVVLVLAGHVLRAARTKVVLDSVRVGTLPGQVQALTVGYAFGLALPLRLGELARAYIASRKLRISFTFTVLAVALERLLDVVLVTTAYLGFAVLVRQPASGAPPLAALGALAGACALITLFVLLVRENPVLIRAAWRTSGWLNTELESRTRFKVWSVIFGFQRFLSDRSRLVRYAALTAASWGCYVAATLALAQALLAGATGGERLVAAATPHAVTSAGLGTTGVPGHLRGVADFLGPTLGGTPAGDAAVTSFAAASWWVLTVPVVLVGLVSLLLLVRPWRRAPAAMAPLQGSYVNKLERDQDISRALPTFLDAYFQRSHLSRVLHRLEVDGDVTLVKFFKGGSNAVTVLATGPGADEVYVRKMVPLEHAHRLKNQHDWLARRADMPQLVTVLREERAVDHYAIDLEYRRESAPMFDYVHANPHAAAVDRLTEVWDWMHRCVYELSPPAVHEAERDAYVAERFEARVRAAAEGHDGLREALLPDRLRVNGHEVDNLDRVMARIRSHPVAWPELATYRTSTAIHGDLTLDNILVDMARGPAGTALVIDPSDDNEVRGPVVDFARHLQSLLYGYEFLNADDSPVALDKDGDGVPSIRYPDHRSARYERLADHVTTQVMTAHLTAVEQRTVLFHVGLFYGRMLTHRVAINPANAVKYYGVCLLALNRFVDQYELPAD